MTFAALLEALRLSWERFFTTRTDESRRDFLRVLGVASVAVVVGVRLGQEAEGLPVALGGWKLEAAGPWELQFIALAADVRRYTAMFRDVDGEWTSAPFELDPVRNIYRATVPAGAEVMISGCLGDASDYGQIRVLR